MKNKNEMITIELTRGEFDLILMSMREVCLGVNNMFNDSLIVDPNHTLLCYMNLPKLCDLYNVIATILGYETRITLIDEENNK